jgi:hypothetical protein
MKLHEKQVPKAINETSNMNKEKGKNSINHVVCANNLFMSSKHKKGRGKRRCFKCKELGNYIASCPDMDTENEVRRRFMCNKEDQLITSCSLMKNQGCASPTMTLTKNKIEQQAPRQAERRSCYKCGEQGHLRKACKKGKVSKKINSSHSYSLGRTKSYTCARPMLRSPRTSTNAIWVPMALLDDLYGPIPR